MTFGTALRLALDSLRRSTLRAVLTVVGIAIGIGAVVVTSALGAGARQQLAAQAATVGVNMLVVTRGGRRPGPAAARRVTELDADAIAHEVADVESTAPVLNVLTQAVAGAQNAPGVVAGTTHALWQVRGWSAAEGELWTLDAERSADRVCVLGQTARRRLFGDAAAVGETLRLGRVVFTVVGVLQPKGRSPDGLDQDDTYFVPIGAARQHLSELRHREVTSIAVSARDGAAIAEVRGQVRALMRQRRHLQATDEDDFQVADPVELAAAVDRQQATVRSLMLAVAAIALLVAGIGVMNVMLVSVGERTREIGVRLALGAQPEDVLTQFLVEASVLASLGGGLGTLGGVASAFALTRLLGWQTAILPVPTLAALAASCGVGVVFGYLPARRAAALDPIAALRHE